MERIEPAIVPQRRLSNGMVIPGIGMGTLAMTSIRLKRRQMQCIMRSRLDIGCLIVRQHMETRKISGSSKRSCADSIFNLRK